MKLYKIAFRNISRNRRRSILSGIAIAVAAAAITVLFGLYGGIRKDLKNNVFSYFTGHIRIRHSEYSENEELNPLHLGIDNYDNLMTRLEKIDSVKALAPRIQFGTIIYGSPRLFIKDISDWEKFLSLLKTSNNSVFTFLRERYRYVRERLAQKGNKIPDLADVTPLTNKMEVGSLLNGLNEALRRYIIYSPERVAGIPLSGETKQYIDKTITFEEKILFNRLLLEDAFPDLIEKNPRAGKMIVGMGMGMDFERDREFINLEENIYEGNLPETGVNVQQIVLAKGLANKINATVGDRITLTSKTKYLGMNGITLTITGIVNLPVELFNSNGFYIPIDTARKLLKMGDSISEILVLLEKESRIKKTVPLINTAISEANLAHVEARPWTTLELYYIAILMLNFVGYYMGLFFFLLGSTVIVTTTMMVIYERMREIGTISAMGMTGKQIIRLFFIESFFIGAIASIIGAIIGSGVSIYLSIFGMDWSEAFESMDFAMSGMIKSSWNIGIPIIVSIYSTIIASLASFIPSRRVAKIPPVEALRAV